MRKRNWKQIGVLGLVLSMVAQGAAPGISASAAGDHASVSVEEPAVYAETETAQTVSDVCYLSDMSIIRSTNDYGKWTRDKDFDTNRAIELTMNDSGTMIFEKGLTANADATAVFDVSAYAGQTFYSYVGVHYSQVGASNGATCDFEVQIDGKSMWKSSKVMNPRDIAEKVVVDIPEGARELTLLVGEGGDGGISDHGVWADACIVENREVLKTLVSADADVAGFIEVGQDTEMTVNAKCFDRTEAEFGDAVEVICESLNEEIASVSGQGGSWTVSGKADGTAKIHITITDTAKGTEIQLDRYIIVGEDESSVKTIASPNGQQKISFILLPSGEVYYKAVTGTGEEKKVVATGENIGLQTSLGDFSKGLSLVEVSTQEVRDSYDLIGAKKSHVDAVGNEIVLKYEKTPNDDGIYFYIIARAYDDGVAFRYQISSGTEQDFSISKELTSVILPEGSVSQAMEFINHNEAKEVEKTNGQMTGAYCMPLLYETEDTFCLVSEAALTQEYAGAAMYGDGTGKMEIRVSEGDQNATPVVITSTLVQDPWGGEEHPWVSPWRFIVVGDLNTINGNTMAETLSPASVIEDTSWITPGASGWTWLNGEGTSSLETYKTYVDMAAEMGWEYVLLDEGWQPRSSKSGYVYYGYYEWFDELMEYANEKGVGILVWANHNDLNTPEKQEVLKEWSEKGIKGVKPDFFNSHSQKTMQLYMQLFQKTAENHLLLNVHGAPKTTGERRTYPNLLTREGIHGAEQILFDSAGVTARHNCTLPFVRNAVGPADFTPMLSTGTHKSPYGGSYTYNGKYTAGQMAAMPIMIESGINCMADTAEVYLNSTAHPLYENLPGGWVNSQVLEADIGKYATIMRESADGRWYIGTICDAARDTDLALDFLPSGEEYHAYIVEDGEGTDVLTIRSETVRREDSLHLDLKATGGALILIQKEELSAVEELVLNEHDVNMETTETLQLTAAVTPEDAKLKSIEWESSDESVVTVKNGKVTPVGVGVAVITATSGTAKDTCKIKVYPGEYEKTAAWSIINEDKEYYKINSENSLTVATEDGGIYLSSKNTANNEFLLEADKDFEASVKLTFSPTTDYQSAGILALALNDDGTNMAYAGLWRRYHSSFSGNVINLVSYNGSSLGESVRTSDTSWEEPIWLKLVKDGTTLTAYTSKDGAAWTKLGQQTNAKLNTASSIKIGVYAANDKTGKANIPATFENFTYKTKDGEEEIIPFGKKTEKEVMCLEMTQNGRTSYLTGEEFEASDYLFHVYYTDRTEEDISGEDCQITGFDTNRGGKQEVIFEYGGKAVSVTVNVMDAGLTESEVTKKLLEEIYEAYAGLDLTAYTEESSIALTEALADAKKILAGEQVEDKTMQDVLEALMQAAADLRIDTTELEKEVETVKAAAKAAQEASDEAKATADQAKTDAETAASAAEAAKDKAAAAKAAADAAETAASQSGVNKEAVEKAKIEAQAAQAAAETAEKNAADAAAQAEMAEEAQNKAEAAKAEAETAQTAAENAKNDAEGAKAQAEAAKKAAETARDEAQSARDAATAAQIAAESAKESAVSQTALAEASRIAAEAAQVAAEAAKLAAEAARDEAAETLRKAQEEAAAKLAKAEEDRKKTQEEAEDKLEKAEALLKEARKIQEQTKEYMQQEAFKAQKVTITAVKSKKKKTANVTWKKVDGAEGYMIEYARKANFKGAKTAAVKKGTAVSKTLKKLKSKKTYYVRVKAYKTVNGERIYTGTGARKKVRIK